MKKAENGKLHECGIHICTRSNYNNVIASYPSGNE